MTMIVGSRRISWRSASFSAWRIDFCGIARVPPFQRAGLPWHSRSTGESALVFDLFRNYLLEWPQVGRVPSLAEGGRRVSAHAYIRDGFPRQPPPDGNVDDFVEAIVPEINLVQRPIH